MTVFFRALLAPLVALIMTAAASTAAAAPVQALHLTADLVAETTSAAPGSTVWVALVQKIDKGWHTYWRNPGDAGEATKIVWTLPPGWQAGDIVWATPRRLPVGPIMNYGYEGQVVLPVPIQVPASARPGQTLTLKAAVALLVCADVCVPADANLQLNLPVAAGTPTPDPAGGPLIAAALAAAPKPQGLSAAFQVAPGSLKLAIAGAPLKGAADQDAYLYPYDDKLIDHAKPQAVDRGPDGLTFSLTPGYAFTQGKAPTEAAGVLVVDGKAYEIAAPAGPPPAGAAGLGPPVKAAPAGGGLTLPLALAFAFLGGLILNLMPCVFPVLSLKAASLAGHGGEERSARAQGLAFFAGVLVTFLALGGLLVAVRSGGAAVGWGFQLQSPPVVAGLALIMLAAALNMSGLFEIGTSVQGVGQGLASRGGLVGSAFTGVLAVVVAAPCTAPFMAGALGYALTQPAAVALAVFACLGLGFAAPFTVLAFTPALMRRLPRPGAWMEILKKGLAFPMYGAAAWLVWVLQQQAGAEGLARILAAAVVLAFGAWVYGAAQRRQIAGGRAVALYGVAGLALALSVAAVSVGGYASARPAPGQAAAIQAPAEGVPSEPWSPERVTALQAQGKPVFVNFTAAWCVTCQVNEKVAFSTGEVARAFRSTGAVYLVADWTNRDAVIAKALADQGRVGVPLYLVYAAGGGAPKVLPQLLTPALVADALNAAARPQAVAAQ